MNRVKDLLPIEGQIYVLPILKQSIHVLKTSFLFSARIWLAFGLLFFGLLLGFLLSLFLGLLLGFLLHNHLAQPVNGRVVNVLHLVHRYDSEHWPIKADGIRLVSRQHIKLDGLIAFEFECIWLGYLILRRYLCYDFSYRCEAIDGPTEVKRVVPVEL